MQIPKTWRPELESKLLVHVRIFMLVSLLISTTIVDYSLATSFATSLLVLVLQRQRGSALIVYPAAKRVQDLSENAEPRREF